MRILVVEDDQHIRNFLKSGLENECFAVDTAENGERGSYLARTNDYDCVILDYMMPKMDGKQACEQVRASGKTMPIIMLSVKAESPTKVELLNTGADDFLSKPFSFDELVARIRALLRRPKQMTQDTLHVGDLVMDIRKHIVTRSGIEIYLTRKEFVLLEYFMRHPGEVQSRGTLIEHVWDQNLDPLSNTVEAHVLNLRKKIERPDARKLIHTIPGRGYKLDARR